MLRNATLFFSVVSLVCLGGAVGYFRAQDDMNLKVHGLRTELSSQLIELRREVTELKKQQ